MIARFYAALDLRHSTQTFLLEITPGADPRHRFLTPRTVLVGRSASEEIDFDERAAGEGGNADAGSRRQPSGYKIGLIDGVHRRVIPLELDQVNASEYDLVEGAAGAGEYALQIFDDLAGLRFDPLR